MVPRAEELLDSSCYSELHSSYDSLTSARDIASRTSVPRALPVYLIPMASKSSQRSQRRPTGKMSHPLPQFPTPTPPPVPFYLPPSQPIPILSSISSNNKDHEFTSGHEHDRQDHYLNQPATFRSPYQPYGPIYPTCHIHDQPPGAFNITSYPFVSTHPAAPLQPDFQVTTNRNDPFLAAPAAPHPPNLSVTSPHDPSLATSVPLPHANLTKRTQATTVPTTRRSAHDHDATALGNIERLPQTPRRHRAMSEAQDPMEYRPPAATASAALEVEQENAVYSTPMLQRISSGRLPDDQRRMKVKDLVPLLKQELATNISQSTTLVDDVFPTTTLPFPVDNTLLQHLAQFKIWDLEEARLLKKPDSYTEASMADWLNLLGRTIGLPYSKKRIRVWSAGNCNLPPRGSTTIRKPDLVLLDRDEYEDSSFTRAHWSTIRAFGEVSGQGSFPQRMFDTINEKSYLLFLTQDNRRFVPALSFDGSGNFSLTVTDRQGQVRMGVISLYASGKECALLLLRVLAVLMYGSLSDIGLDASMICDGAGHVTSIVVNNKEFTVFRRIYALQALVGRGTKVWVVIRDGQYYILKDSWVQLGRVESEVDFLQRMAKYPELAGCIPRLIEGEDLRIRGEVDSTNQYRSKVGQVNRHRIHRRHVTEPIGSPLIKFSSKAEFLSAIIHVVEVLDFLFTQLRILHRDISPNNILFARDAKGDIRCLLIDFDYAVTVKEVSSEQQVSHGFRTGTPPFMALEIMLNGGKKFRHELRHDLESIFYVLVWVCCHMLGPEVERHDAHGLPIREWCNMGSNLRKLGLVKLSHIADSEDSLLGHFTTYWNDFKPFIRSLITAFWPNGFRNPNSITSEKMLMILREALSAVQETEVQCDDMNSPMLQSYVILNNKRHRQGQDVAIVSKRLRSGGRSSKSQSVVQDFGVWKETIMVKDPNTTISSRGSA